MENNKTMGISIAVAVAILMGVILITIIAEQTVTKTLTTSTTETVNIAGVLNAKVTETVANQTHGTSMSSSLKGSTFILPTVTENAGHNLSCTQPIITNESSGNLITGGNWSWATTTTARGRCGIVIGNVSDAFNNSKWNMSYVVTYYDINVSKTLTVVNAPTGWKSTDCPLTNGVLKNKSGDATLTDGTDYVMDETTGIFTLRPTLTVNITEGNNFEGSYSYCGDDYINSSWARTILNLVPGFFALAILLGAAFVIFYILKNEGIDIQI